MDNFQLKSETRRSYPLGLRPDPSLCAAPGSHIAKGLWGRSALPQTQPSGLQLAKMPAHAEIWVAFSVPLRPRRRLRFQLRIAKTA